MDKIIIRVLIFTTVGILLAFLPRAAHAQSPQEPTQVSIGAPSQSNLGESLTVQALLVDSKGHPISKEVIYFMTQTTFMGKSDNVVLAQAVTNSNGQAVAQFVNNFSGTIQLRAEFQGDAQYAPSHAAAQVGIVGGQQVYVDHVGVDIPGFNVPPVSAPVASVQSPASFIEKLWPAMNGWPVAAVLLLVWSMYLLTVRFIFRVADLGSKPEELPEFDSRRSQR